MDLLEIIKEQKEHIERLEGVLQDLLPAINRLILSDDENLAILEAAKLVEYPLERK